MNRVIENSIPTTGQQVCQFLAVANTCAVIPKGNRCCVTTIVEKTNVGVTIDTALPAKRRVSMDRDPKMIGVPRKPIIPGS